MPLRHQLAAYSPLTLADCVTGAASVLSGRDARTELRELLLAKFNATDVLLCGSGTQALQAAITLASARLAGSAGPTIALPAFGCFDLASAAIGANARVLFYDLDPETLGPDFDSLQRAIAEGGRIVVITPLYGMPVDWDRVMTIASAAGAVVIEDAAQGHGASWHDTPLGALGVISTLSFGRGKGWTGGGGGALLVRDDTKIAIEVQTASLSRDVKTAAGLLAQWSLGRPSTYGIPRSIPGLHLGETIYHAPSVLSRMTRVAAATAVSDFERSNAEAIRRREAGERLRAAMQSAQRFANVRGLDSGTPGYLRFPVRWIGGAPATLDARTRAAGIERSYPLVLSELAPLAPHIARGVARWPGAAQLVSELITLPTHSRSRVQETLSVLL